MERIVRSAFKPKGMKRMPLTIVPYSLYPRYQRMMRATAGIRIK